MNNAELDKLLASDPRYLDKLVKSHAIYKLVLARAILRPGEPQVFNLGRDVVEPGAIYHRSWKGPDGSQMVELNLLAPEG